MRLRGRPRNRWQDKVREYGRLVGGKGWKERVCNREEWKKLLRTARNRRILNTPMGWMKFHLPYFIAEILIADLQPLSKPRTFWQYLSIQELCLDILTVLFQNLLFSSPSSCWVPYIFSSAANSPYNGIANVTVGIRFQKQGPYYLAHTHRNFKTMCTNLHELHGHFHKTKAIILALHISIHHPR